VSRLNARGGRSVVRNDAFHQSAGAEQFNSNPSGPPDKCVPCRIRYRLAHDHSQSHAPARFQQQRRSREHQFDLHGIELRSADRAAQFAQVCLCVEDGFLIRGPKRAMDLSVMVQDLRNSPQGAFDVITGGSPRRTRNDGDERADATDPVVELVEQQRLLDQWEVRNKFRHDAL
jgi:hypothetical protein